MTVDPSIIISCISLLIAAVTAWLTLFRRGTLAMTQPTMLFFGPDGGKPDEPKVFLRTLLYSTSQRGQLIESMFVRLRRKESVQVFNIWVYGERQPTLVRGSGLHVGQEGVAFNHHFALPKDGTRFEFLPGDYVVEVFAKVVNRSDSKLLWRLNLNLVDTLAAEMKKHGAGVYFDWGPDSKQYHAHIREARDEVLSEDNAAEFIKAFKEAMATEK